MSSPGSKPPTPRPAATVIVARDGQHEIEVLLARRAVSLRFMGGAYVFPGGAVHASDSDARLAQYSRAAAAWPGSTDLELDTAHAWTGVRETLEEVGLLLTCPAIEPDRLVQLRAKLAEHDSLVLALAECPNTAIDLQQLQPLVRWITPEEEPIRFDARFYIAPAPSGQTPQADGRETTELIWISPARAIEASRLKQMLIFPPTVRTLQMLISSTTVVQLMDHARHTAAVTMAPSIRVNSDGSRDVVYPGESGEGVRMP
jgi:8-oxo-dGTP pyrophosphatase MutT (NUDIX family)